MRPLDHQARKRAEAENAIRHPAVGRLVFVWREVSILHFRRIGVCCIVVAAGLIGLAGEAMALFPVELGYATVEVTCAGGGTSSETSQQRIVTLVCDVLGNDFAASALADANLDTPEVFVETSAVGDPVTSIAVSTITSEMRVNQIKSPPTPTSIVDIMTFSSGEASVSGTGFGSVHASIDGPMHDNTTLALGPPDFENEKISIGVEPDEVYTVKMRASCQSASSQAQPDAHCVAILDPQVFLDQEAFDARMGASTYPLAEYYSVEISGNIGPRLVPTLSGWAVFVVGLALLIVGVLTLSRAGRLATRA